MQTKGLKLTDVLTTVVVAIVFGIVYKCGDRFTMRSNRLDFISINSFMACGLLLRQWHIC